MIAEYGPTRRKIATTVQDFADEAVFRAARSVVERDHSDTNRTPSEV